MASLDKLIASYIKSNKSLTRKETSLLFSAILKEFETRAFGDYTNRTVDNLTLLQKVLPEVLQQGRRDQICTNTPRPFDRNLFSSTFLTQIINLEYRFYFLSDFVHFHLPLGEKYSDTSTVLYFEGPEDDPDMFGGHVGCEIEDGHMRGCDICEVLYLLDWNTSGPESISSIEGTILGMDGKRFDVEVNGAWFTIQGRVNDGKVVGLQLQGELEKLDWRLWKTRVEIERKLVRCAEGVEGCICERVHDDDDEVDVDVDEDLMWEYECEGTTLEMEDDQGVWTAEEEDSSSESEQSEDCTCPLVCVCAHDVGQEAYRHYTDNGVCCNNVAF